MDGTPLTNPASRSRRQLAAYRALVLASWALAFGVSIYCSVRAPGSSGHGHGHGHHRLGRQNRHHPTAFSPSTVLVYVYWCVLFAGQVVYAAHLVVPAVQTEGVQTGVAAAVAGPFAVHNVLHAVWVWLFATGHFAWAEAVLLVNFFNLTVASFRGPAAASSSSSSASTTTSIARRTLVHAPAVAGPLAWTFVALYWNGAVLLPHADSLVLRILANVFIWGILVYGLFYLVVYEDTPMGFCLAWLAAALGFGQLTVHVFALQWIFAFVIAGLLFVAAAAVAASQWTGRALPAFARGDRERAPLLADA